MPYVQRIDGSIVGAFSAQQHGFATEHIDENDPELIAFRNRSVFTEADNAERGIKKDPALLALVRRTAKKEGITERALLDEIRAEAKEVVRQ